MKFFVIVLQAVSGVLANDIFVRHIISIQFPAQAGPKKFMLLPSLGGGFLRLGTEDDLLVQSNAKLLQMDGSLERRLKSAEAALEPYQQYL